MAYQWADLEFFDPSGFEAIEVQHREMMTRVVAQHLHEDLAIGSITPLRVPPMQFGPVQDVIHDFLEDHMRVSIREIQPSHLVQGLVRFVHVHDNDSLVFNIPYIYGDVQISLIKHNEGRTRDLSTLLVNAG
jgi:hypothetical protein